MTKKINIIYVKVNSFILHMKFIDKVQNFKSDNFNSKQKNVNQNPKYCFIIPFYNVEKWISFTLNSILLQSQNNYRIICIDDCSVDNTVNIIKSYNLENLTLIQNNQNMGPAYSRFRGIQYTNNDEILIFLDGDDWLSNENVLDELDKIFINYKLTIGGYKKYVNGKISIQRNIIEDINKPVRTSLKAGYAYLWKDMPLNYIIKNGEFINYATDYHDFRYALSKISLQDLYINQKCLYIYNNDRKNSTDTIIRKVYQDNFSKI